MVLYGKACYKMDVLDVYKKLDDEGISVMDCKIPNIKGLSIQSGNKQGVFLNYDEIENADEEFCVVAHEYGHCVAGTFYSNNSDKSYISQCEYKADRKSVLLFLPIEKLNKAIAYGCQMSYEFADFLGMPEKFVVLAFKHYRDMGLI